MPTSSPFTAISVSVDGAIGTIWLDRPDKLNALTPASMHELRALFTEIDDDENVHVAVLRGAGDRAFCAGMDLKWSEGLTPRERIEQGRLGEKTFSLIERTSVPVIAAVQGFCLGGGIGLAGNADIVIAADDATFGLPEVDRGATLHRLGGQRTPPGSYGWA